MRYGVAKTVQLRNGLRANLRSLCDHLSFQHPHRLSTTSKSPKWKWRSANNRRRKKGTKTISSPTTNQLLFKQPNNWVSNYIPTWSFSRPFALSSLSGQIHSRGTRESPAIPNWSSIPRSYLPRGQRAHVCNSRITLRAIRSVPLAQMDEEFPLQV